MTGTPPAIARPGRCVVMAILNVASGTAMRSLTAT